MGAHDAVHRVSAVPEVVQEALRKAAPSKISTHHQLGDPADDIVAELPAYGTDVPGQHAADGDAGICTRFVGEVLVS